MQTQNAVTDSTNELLKNTQSSNPPAPKEENEVVTAIQHCQTSLEHKVYTVEHGKEKLLFIPAYCALLVKKASHLDLKESQFRINCTLILRIHTLNVKATVLEQIRERVEFRLCEEVISLQKGITEGLTFAERDNLMIFTYRFVRVVSFNAELKTTPFDCFDIPIEFEMTSTYTDKLDGFKYRFNLHEHMNRQKTLSFKPDANALAQFDILQTECATTLVSERKQQGDKIIYIYYPKIIFKMRIIRNPWRLLLTNLFPVIVLELLSLTIFLQANDVAAKVANIAMIMLALLIYMPVIRTDIPSDTYVTFSDIFINSSVLINVLVLLETVILHKTNEQIGTWIIFGLTGFIFLMNALFLCLKVIKHSYQRKGLSIPLAHVKEASTGFNQIEWINLNLEKLLFAKDAKIHILN